VSVAKVCTARLEDCEMFRFDIEHGQDVSVVHSCELLPFGAGNFLYPTGHEAYQTAVTWLHTNSQHPEAAGVKLGPFRAITTLIGLSRMSDLQLLPPAVTCTGNYMLKHCTFTTQCVPYGSHSKQRLFPQTALTGWAL
jgi:hypothetical protein